MGTWRKKKWIITLLYNLKQVISEPTHLVFSSSSYINLIFAEPQNSLADCSVHLSLTPNAKIRLFIQYLMQKLVIHGLINVGDKKVNAEFI